MAWNLADYLESGEDEIGDRDKFAAPRPALKREITFTVKTLWNDYLDTETGKQVVEYKDVVYTARLWDKAPGKERYYITKEGDKDSCCYYDVAANAVKAQKTPKMFQEIAVAFRAASGFSKTPKN